MKKVSVILTTYNSENSIQDVINSIKNQEGINVDFEIELIVVDDCSSDKTTEILKDNNILYQSTEKNSGGPNKGRNIALKHSTGDFICIADHDDVWFPNKVISLLKYSEKAPIITSGYTLEDINTGRKEDRVKESSDGHLMFEKDETFLTKLTKSRVGQQTYLGSIMFSSNLKEILFEEEIGMIDFDWVLKLFYNRKSVEISKSLYLRKVDGKNLSLNENYRINDYNFSLQTIKSYSKKFPEEVNLSEKRINGSMGRYYYLIGNMKLSRGYLLKSSINIKMILYLITTFVGSKIVKKYFNIFG